MIPLRLLAIGRHAAVATLLVIPAACSWIEWSEDEAAPPAPAPVVTAAPAAEPPFVPSKLPVPRPPITAEPLPEPPMRAPSVDGRHTVKRGETLFSIARVYDTDPFTLASLNSLRPPYGLEAGQVLRVPQRGEAAAAPVAEAPPPRPTLEPATAALPSASEAVAPPPAATPPAATPPTTRSETPDAAAALAVPAPQTDAADGSGFAWPVNGEVVSSFGARADGSRNDGIDIAAKRGSPVRAARAGRVHYAGNQLKSYGNIVIISHDNGWWTVYAHADDILVDEGQMVKKGDVIARVGSSGDVTQSLLHFEMRQGKERKPVNPLRYLPRRRA